MKFREGDELSLSCPFIKYGGYGTDTSVWYPVYDQDSWMGPLDEDMEPDGHGMGKCHILIEEAFPSKTGVDILVIKKRFVAPDGSTPAIRFPRKIQRASHLKAFITKLESSVSSLVFKKMENKSNPKKAFDELSSSIMNYF